MFGPTCAPQQYAKNIHYFYFYFYFFFLHVRGKKTVWFLWFHWYQTKGTFQAIIFYALKDVTGVLGDNQPEVGAFDAKLNKKKVKTLDISWWCCSAQSLNSLRKLCLWKFTL